VKRISKLLIVPFGVLALSNVSSASMLEQLIYNVAGQATNAAGARLGDEIYYGSSRGGSTHKVRRKHKKRHVAPVPVMTDEKRIQQSLTSLGFYHGRIDGQINSFETRNAIKDMNIAYGIGNDASLRQEVRDTLIYLGTLFEFDRYLIAGNTNNRAKNKKIQVALKIHGYYHSSIDGAIGRGSRNAIREYQMGSGLAATGALDYESEYQLISSSKEKNDRNLNDSINTLKSFGVNRVAPQGYNQPMQQGYNQQQPMQQQRYQAPAQQGYNQQQTAYNNQQQPMQQQGYQAPVQQGYQQNNQPVVVPQARMNKTVQQPVETVNKASTQVAKDTVSASSNKVNNAMPDASSIEMYTDSKK